MTGAAIGYRVVRCRQGGELGARGGAGAHSLGGRSGWLTQEGRVAKKLAKGGEANVLAARANGNCLVTL